MRDDLKCGGEFFSDWSRWGLVSIEINKWCKKIDWKWEAEDGTHKKKIFPNVIYTERL